MTKTPRKYDHTTCRFLSRGSLAWGAIASFLFLFSSCKKEIDYLGLELQVTHEKLSNGIQVVLLPLKGFQTTSLQTWVRTGSIHDEDSKSGVAHLLSRFFLLDPAIQDLEKLGIEISADTGREGSYISYLFDPRDIERVIDSDAGRLTRAAVQVYSSALAQVKVGGLEELRLGVESTKDFGVSVVLWNQAFHFHPYSRPSFGNPNEYLEFQSEDFEKFINKRYLPSQTAVVVTGSIPNPTSTLRLIRRAYGSWKVSEKISGKKNSKDIDLLPEILPEPAQQEERIYTLHEPTQSSRFAVGYHIPSAYDPDAYAIDVLTEILFEGDDSWAHAEWIEKKKLAGMSALSLTPRYPGLLTISGILGESVTFEEIRAGLDRMVERVQKQGVSKDEVSRAVRQLTLGLMDFLRTPRGTGQLLGNVFTIFGEFETFQKDLEKYLSVTADDVQRVAKKYLDPNNRTIVQLSKGVAGK